MPDAPRTSAGTPWTGQTWRCVLCPATGPDRDDLALVDDCQRGYRGMHVRRYEVHGWELQYWQNTALEMARPEGGQQG